MVVNPISGGGKAHRVWQRESTSWPTDPDLDFKTYQTQKLRDVDGIKAAIDVHNPDVVVSMGGDGTLNDVINAVDRRLPVLLYPGGSGNDFATLLKIDPNKTIKERVMHAQIRSVDIGKCNDQLFINGLGIGFDGEVSYRTFRNKSKVPPWLKYYPAIIGSILFYRETPAKIITEERSEESDYFMITVANGTKYGGGFHVSPKSIEDDGLLDIVTIRKVAPVLRPVYLPAVLLGKHLGLSFVDHWRTKKITVTSDQIIHAHVDGEMISGERFEVEVMPLGQEMVL